MIKYDELYAYTASRMRENYNIPVLYPDITIDPDLSINGRFTQHWLRGTTITLVDWGSPRMESILVHEFVHFILWANDNPLKRDEEEALAQQIEKEYLDGRLEQSPSAGAVGDDT